MSRFLFFFFILLPNIHVFAQKRLDIGVQLEQNIRVLSVERSGLSDSFENADQGTASWGAKMMLTVPITEYWSLSLGAGYNGYSFKRIKNNLGFLDTIHPDVGVVHDLSQASEKSVAYNFKYRFIEVYTGVERELYITRRNVPAFWYYRFGLIHQVFVASQTNIRLMGFSYLGDQKFKSGTTEYLAKPYNLGAYISLNLAYAIKENHYYFLASVEARGMLTNMITNPGYNMRFFNIGAQLGVQIYLPN